MNHCLGNFMLFFLFPFSTILIVNLPPPVPRCYRTIGTIDRSAPTRPGHRASNWSLAPSRRWCSSAASALISMRFSPARILSHYYVFVAKPDPRAREWWMLCARPRLPCPLAVGNYRPATLFNDRIDDLRISRTMSGGGGGWSKAIARKKTRTSACHMLLFQQQKVEGISTSSSSCSVSLSVKNFILWSGESFIRLEMNGIEVWISNGEYRKLPEVEICWKYIYVWLGQKTWVWTCRQRGSPHLPNPTTPHQTKETPWYKLALIHHQIGFGLVGVGGEASACELKIQVELLRKFFLPPEQNSTAPREFSPPPLSCLWLLICSDLEIHGLAHILFMNK